MKFRGKWFGRRFRDAEQEQVAVNNIHSDWAHHTHIQNIWRPGEESFGILCNRVGGVFGSFPRRTNSPNNSSSKNHPCEDSLYFIYIAIGSASGHEMNLCRL